MNAAPSAQYAVAGAGLPGAPERLVNKTPSADLETLRPLRSDEGAYGVGYEEIDDFLEGGKPVSDAACATILRFYDATRHKRARPYTPYDPMPGTAES